jgi:hypothetical protein
VVLPPSGRAGFGESWLPIACLKKPSAKIVTVKKAEIRGEQQRR